MILFMVTAPSTLFLSPLTHQNWWEILGNAFTTSLTINACPSKLRGYPWRCIHQLLARISQFWRRIISHKTLKLWVKRRKSNFTIM